MAKFRKMKKSRRASGKAYARRSGGSGGLSPMNVLLAGAVYGAARPYVSKMLPDLFSFGGVVDSDNVIIGAASYYGMKKSGFIKALSAVALGSEAGIITARVTAKQLGGEVDNSELTWN